MNQIFSKTQELCRKYNIKPARSKGQNFLIEESAYEKIVESAELQGDDIVLEVGPGLGFLTEKMAGKAKKIIAVELDDKLAKALSARLKEQGIDNAEVLNEDILKISNFQFPISNKNDISRIKNQEYFEDYKIVANLPYNITSFFLRRFLSSEIKPGLMVLMLQKEVAERIAAKPGKMSLLAVSVQFYCKPGIIAYVPSKAFWPEPQVDSAIIKLKFRSEKGESVSERSENIRRISRDPNNPLANEKLFFRLVKHGFSARRKMLKNNLAGGLRISQEEAEERLLRAGFDPKTRAQDLSVDDWIKLFGYFLENML